MFLKDFSIRLPVPASVICDKGPTGWDVREVESGPGEITVIIGLDGNLDDAAEAINLVREALKSIGLEVK